MAGHARYDDLRNSLKPQFRAAFARFMETGEADDDFRAYLRSDEAFQAALEAAVGEEDEAMRRAFRVLWEQPPYTQKEFLSLLGEYERLIFAIFFRKGLLGNDVDDLVQEAFLRLWRNSERFCGHRNPKAYLLTVVHSVYVDYVRERGRKMTLIEDFATYIDDSAKDPAHEGTSSERQELLLEALETLPDGQRAVLLLRLEGLSYSQIAELLDVPETTVNNWISRATAGVREFFSRKVQQ